jgi:hypothetical protein
MDASTLMVCVAYGMFLAILSKHRALIRKAIGAIGGAREGDCCTESKFAVRIWTAAVRRFRLCPPSQPRGAQEQAQSRPKQEPQTPHLPCPVVTVERLDG